MNQITIEKTTLYENNKLNAIAHWVSQIGSPPIISILTVLLVAMITPSPLYWVTLYTVPIILFPSLYVFTLFKLGKLQDVHMPHRQDRIIPLLISVIVSIFVYIWFILNQAPYSFILLATANVIQTILYFAVNLHWKISVHAAMSIAVAIIAWSIWGTIATPLWLAVPLICWARIYTQRHTVGEVIAGIIAGTTIFGTIFLLN